MDLATILISGAEVRDRYLGNRGAEQLLRTVCARLRAMGLRPAVTYGQVDRILVHELGLQEYVGNPRLARLDKLIPRINSKQFVTIDGLAGVIDASGFVLGDAWGNGPATWISRKYKQWAAAGLPIVALPQAYGPFQSNELAETVSAAISLCQVAFPRDSISRDHLLKLGCPERVAHAVPDITIAEPVKEAIYRENRLVIVPNWNLVERGDGQSYLRMLDETVAVAKDKGLEVVGVLHEGPKDLEVFHSMSSLDSIRIEASLTGWETKKFIAASRAVVSGRYHAVVAALSTGTPVIAHSWSHKYEEALAGFGVADWIMQPDDLAELSLRIEKLLSEDRTAELVAGRAHAVGVIEGMWKQVSEILLGNKGTGRTHGKR